MGRFFNIWAYILEICYISACLFAFEFKKEIAIRRHMRNVKYIAYNTKI